MVRHTDSKKWLFIPLNGTTPTTMLYAQVNANSVRLYTLASKDQPLADSRTLLRGRQANTFPRADLLGMLDELGFINVPPNFSKGDLISLILTELRLAGRVVEA